MPADSPFPISFPRQFDNAAQWLAALGDVPLERIRFNPLPGTANEADLLYAVEHEKCLCELIDGTLVEKPVSFWKALVGGNVIGLLATHVNPNGLGALLGANATLRMRSGRIRLPDISYVSKARLPKTSAPVPALAPDLAVEVLSESNTAKEIDQKLIDYFESGTRLAWVVDPPTRIVAVYTAPGQPTKVVSESDTLDGDPVLPGLTIRVADMFLNVPRPS